MNVPNLRGKKQTFTYGNDSLSITGLLRKPEIVGYLEKDGPLTQGSRREKLRKLLREGRINRRWSWNAQPGTQRHHESKTRVTERNDGGQSSEDHERRSAIWTRTTTEGTQEARWSHHRQRENLTARQALERFPRFREFFQRDRRISEKSLHAKVRTRFRKGRIPDH